MFTYCDFMMNIYYILKNKRVVDKGAMYFVFALINLLFVQTINGQSIPCNSAQPFCTGINYDFPNSTSGTTPTGVNLGCMSSAPRPVWYFMQIGQTGPIVINLSQTTGPNGSGTGLDVDFAMWGPFNDMTAGCASISAGAPPIQSSYSASSTETIGIGAPGGSNSICSIGTGGATTPPAPQPGDYYIVLITNYNGSAGYVNFNQTNSGNSGAGSTSCNVLNPGATNNGPLCAGQTLNLQITGGLYNPNWGYEWSGPNNFTSTVQNPVINNAQPSHSGTYMLVVYDQADPANTRDTTYTTVQIDPLPVLQVTFDDTVCVGASVAFNMNGTVPANNVRFGFDLDGNNVFEHTVYGRDTTFTFNAPGVYNFNVRATTYPAGCVETRQYRIVVYPSPNVNLLASKTEICLGETVSLQVNATIPNLPSLTSTIQSFNWDLQGDGVIDTAGANLNALANITLPQVGVYNVVTTVVTSRGCSAKDSVAVTVNQLPVTSFIPTNICSGSQALLEANSEMSAPGYISNYNWSVSGNGYSTTSTDSIFNVSFPGAGTYFISLNTTSNEGCHYSVSDTIKVSESPIADFSVQGCLNIFYFTATTTGGTPQYTHSWDLTQDSIIDTISNGFQYKFADASPKDITMYVVDQNGCTDTITKPANPVLPTDVPNVLSLGSTSGNNEMLLADFDYCNYELSVYNRWGKRVFNTKNNPDDVTTLKYFEGKSMDGNNLSPGTYFYVIKGDSDIEYKGTITIFD